MLRGQRQHRRRGPHEYVQIHRKPPGGDAFKLNPQVESELGRLRKLGNWLKREQCENQV